MALRQRHGITVMAVRRGRQTVGSPAGDRLVMVAMADQFAECADLFRAPSLAG